MTDHLIVSGRARQLNHKLGNRKNAILRRREVDADPNMFEQKGSLQRHRSSPMSPAETNGFTKQQPSTMDDQSQSPPSGFTAVNTRQSLDGDSREPDPRLERLYAEANTGNVTIVNGRNIKGASPTLRAELMKKFFSSTDREARTEDGTRRSSSNAAGPQLTPGYTAKTRPRSDSLEFAGSQQAAGGSTVAIPSTPASLLPQVKISYKDLDDGGPFKTEMVKRMEIMDRGQRVIPPCDRCRRLHMDCLKNLTACMGCTKKHAKCSWRDVRVEELQRPWGTTIAEALAAEAEDAKKDEELKDLLTNQPSPTRDPSPYQPRSQPPSHAESVNEVARESNEESPAQPTEGDRSSEKPEDADKPRFDVRPPPMAQQQANGRGQYNPLPFYSQVKDSIEHDENDEGDRLQALAAQVYRSASQSVRPQTQES